MFRASLTAGPVPFFQGGLGFPFLPVPRPGNPLRLKGSCPKMEFLGKFHKLFTIFPSPSCIL